jgi:CheY-like chemotaxis protein
MILCIDDEEIGLSVRKMVLESGGYDVATALSGPEGLKLFAANPVVEAVVLEYSMPGMNGDEVAAELKRLNPKIKILLLTAYVDLPSLEVLSPDSLSHATIDSYAARGVLRQPRAAIIRRDLSEIASDVSASVLRNRL